MQKGATIASGQRASFIGVAAAAGVMVALSGASFSHAQRAGTAPPAADQEAVPPDARKQRGSSRSHCRRRRRRRLNLGSRWRLPGLKPANPPDQVTWQRAASQ
jgi:hypothetical protein